MDERSAGRIFITSTVYAVTTSQLDGRPVVVSGGDDKTLRVWDLANGQQLRDLVTYGGDGKVYSVATARLKEQTAVFASCGRTVRAWDLATGRPLMFRLPRRAGRVKALAAMKWEGRTVAPTTPRCVRRLDGSYPAAAQGTRRLRGLASAAASADVSTRLDSNAAPPVEIDLDEVDWPARPFPTAGRRSP